jgi:exosortase H (IPTLxxWG-CTERM-specific)
MAESPNTKPAPSEGPVKLRRDQYRFIASLSLGLLLGIGLLLAPITQPGVEWATAQLAHVCAGLVRLAGGQAEARNNILTNPANGFSIEIKDVCNGSNVTLLLWVAILSFPAPWLQKAKGLVAGTAALHTINLLRLLSLFYLGQHNPGWFEFAHLYVWESAIMVATLAIFSFWVARVKREREARIAR